MTPQRHQPRQERAGTNGPVIWIFMVAIGLVSVAMTAWVVGMLVTVGGCFTFWQDRCERHALDLVQEDLEYIAAAPRSLLVGDTVAFSLLIVDSVRRPFERLGVLHRYQRLQSQDNQNGEEAAAQPGSRPGGITKAARTGVDLLVRGAVLAMLVAQDVLLRLSVALFALPAFALAVLLGALDGFVRRDLRRWSGGRESSVIYHHAKHYTLWALTGGFGLYLSWPFGGFNPAYMVLVFTVLVAATLSTSVGAYKKYL